MTTPTATSKANRILNILLIGIILVVALHYWQSSSLEKDKLIEKEDIICLVAICINEKGVGDQCFELEGSLTLVSVTKDSVTQNGKRLIIEPSLKQCANPKQDH